MRIRKTYAPGSIDYGISEVKQAEPLEVTATAELLEGQIRIQLANWIPRLRWSARAAWSR